MQFLYAHAGAPGVVVANSTTFDSVSYTAVPDETPGRPVPEYEEITDQERELSKEKDVLIHPAKLQPDSNGSCGGEPLENKHEFTVVS